MIVLITTRGNGYTFQSLVRGTFGVATPTIRLNHYERLFGSWSVPRATYIFSDIERLAPWELRLAADLYRALSDAGLRCLNDPARAMSRLELLQALHAEGVNPFTAMRADERPRPARFPVFTRHEDDHLRASPELYHDQQGLDCALAGLRDSGTPLRGLLVIEHCAAPYSDELWAKWGSWRIADGVFVDHLLVEDNWLVKTGEHSEKAKADERDAFLTDRYSTRLRRAFEIGGIDFGRADHADVDGKTVVYEINTNPFVVRLGRGGDPLSLETRIKIRTRIAEALAAVDTPDRGRVRIKPSALRRPIRWWRPGFVTPRRP